MIGKITEATKDEAGRVNIPYGDKSIFFVWKYKLKRVYFSGTRRGDAMEIHIATKNGKGMIRRAVNSFCEAIFLAYEWCNKITALIYKQSLVECAKSCSFEVLRFLADAEGKKMTLVRRFKDGRSFSGI